jgi:FKBP-type peptidyl-prolyl cis-trans isomerase 2
MSSLTHRVVLLVGVVGLVIAACAGDDAATTTTASESTTTTTTTAAATTTTGAPAGADTSDGQVVQAGDAVSVHYTGTLDDGTVFDSSVGGETLDFTQGAGQMISGFDAAVLGMAIGEKKTVRLSPDEAYGERSDDAIIEIPREQVPDDVAEGQELFSSTGQRVTVLEVRDDVVVIDANHPLAGEFLTFEIELVSIN